MGDCQEGYAVAPPIIMGVGAGAYCPSAYCGVDDSGANPANAVMAVSTCSINESQHVLTSILRVLQFIIWRRGRGGIDHVEEQSLAACQSKA